MIISQFGIDFFFLGTIQTVSCLGESPLKKLDRFHAVYCLVFAI